MLVDLHAHQLTAGMLNQDDFYGPFWTGSGLKIGKWQLRTNMPNRPSTTDVDEAMSRFGPDFRLGQMDSYGVDKLVVSVPAHTFMYWAPAEVGIKYSANANNELAEFCTASPERLYFFANAPMQDPTAAVKEIDRAINQLGARGVSIGGANFGGVEADDESLYPVWDKMCEVDLPLFVHGYNQSVTWENPDDDRYDLSSILGMCEDETRFFWNAIMGGVLDEFPNLKIYITHAGGYVPFQLGRFEVLAQTMAPDRKAKKQVVDYMGNFWFDPLATHVATRKAIVDVIGVDRMLYGDNFAGADMIDFDLTEGLDLSETDREKIRSTNAIELLKL